MSSVINKVKRKIFKKNDPKKEYPLPLPPNDEWIYPDNIDHWEWIDNEEYIQIKLKTGPPRSKNNKSELKTSYQCSVCFQLFEFKHASTGKNQHKLGKYPGTPQNVVKLDVYPFELPKHLKLPKIKTSKLVNGRYTIIEFEQNVGTTKRAYQCMKCRQLFTKGHAVSERKEHFNSSPCAYNPGPDDSNWQPKEGEDYERYTSDQSTFECGRNHYIEYRCLNCQYVTKGYHGSDKIKTHFANGKCKEKMQTIAGKDTLFREEYGRDNKLRYVCNECNKEFVKDKSGLNAIIERNLHFQHGRCEFMRKREKDLEEGNLEGENEYWRKVENGRSYYYECLICEDKKFTNTKNDYHAFRHCIDHMYASHRPFDRIGACMDCGLTYLTPSNRYHHEKEKANGFDCKNKYKQKISCNNNVVDERTPLEKLLETIPVEDVGEHLFGPKKYRCRCGYGTNDKRSFIDHVTKLRFPGECIVIFKSDYFKELQSNIHEN